MPCSAWVSFGSLHFSLSCSVPLCSSLLWPEVRLQWQKHSLQSWVERENASTYALEFFCQFSQKSYLNFFFGYQHLIDLSPPLRYIFQRIFSLPWTLQTGRCDQLLPQRLPYNQPIRGRLLPGDRPQHGGVGLGGEQAQPGLDKGAVTQ